MEFIVLTTTIVILSYSYLRKPCRYWANDTIQGNEGVFTKSVNHTTLTRPIYHILVTTSLVYLLASILGYYLHEYIIAYLCFMTFLSSSLYHIYGEQQYFNFDNIFATSLFMIFIWSLFLSLFVHNNIYHNILSLIGFPLAVYLLVGCGMPGEIKYYNNTFTCIRCQPTIYPTLHSWWHIVSGLGICASIIYFHQVRKSDNLRIECAYLYDGLVTCGSSCYFDESSKYPIVPIISLLLSTSINLYGNYSRIMPLD